MDLIKIILALSLGLALLASFGPLLFKSIKSFIEQLVKYYTLTTKREDGEKIDG